MDKYHVVLTIAKHGSFTKAAYELGYTQAALSHIVKSFENELQIKLFKREQFGVSLTAAGAELMKIIGKIDELETNLSETAFMFRTGSIRIGTFFTVSLNWVPKILNKFQNLYPDAAFKILEQPDYITIEENVKKDIVDCSFTADNRYSGVDFIPLLKDYYYAVVPENSPLAAESEVSIEQLRDYPFILTSDGVSGSIFKDIIHKLSPRSNFIANNLEDYSTLALVESGFGISLLPGLTIENTRAKIKKIKLKEHYYRQIGIICRDYDAANSITKAFIWVADEYSNTCEAGFSP